ncbi:MAG: hypothetical protein IIZ10_01735, partial [Solobacterium sp.]|nr:hypothetical protein [Solobacterium sp.]
MMTTLHAFTSPASAMTRAMGEADPGIVLGTETDETEETANPSEPAPTEVSDSEELSLTDGQTDETDSEPAETAAEPEAAEEPAAPATETAPEPAEPAVSVLPGEAEDRNETDDAETVLTLTGSANRLDVTVEYEVGTFPEGTTMEVITVGSPSVINAINEAVAENNKEAVRIQAVDIIFRSSDGEKIEPSRPVRVTMKSKSIPANASDSPVVVHVDDALDTSVMNAELTENETSQKTVAFEADSFSVYAVVYTVDFEYSVNGKMYQFSLPGGGFVSFTDLVEVLGIIGDTNSDENGSVSAENTEENAANKGTEENSVNSDTNTQLTLGDVEVSEATREFVADVASVEFSSPELVDVSKVENETTVGKIKDSRGLECEYSAELTEEQIAEINVQTVKAGDWALISVQPFVSEETLTVTMKDGEVFSIHVTDAQIKKTVI